MTKEKKYNKNVQQAYISEYCITELKNERTIFQRSGFWDVQYSGRSLINSLNDCRKTTQAGLLDKYMRRVDCNPEFTISLIQRNCLYQKIGKLSIGLDHIRSPAKSHKLLATISTQSQSSGSNASWSADLMANENCANFLQPAGLGLPPIKQQTAGGERQWTVTAPSHTHSAWTPWGEGWITPCKLTQTLQDKGGQEDELSPR